ncbi:uncharacterized protein LOC143525546 [Brachyhypopomus gauderio]|uniref:uncharacterized protein LOC143525546 n=1 Tax=Brachyhypopomus gauderio TaxID=698409 RepID=UPI0040429F9C
MPILTTEPLKSAVLDRTQMVCRVERCHDRGECVMLNGLPACDCMLGYKGHSCMETVNGGLSIPLTLGFLACVLAFIILAFVFAFVRQRRKAAAWKQKDGGNGVLLSHTTEPEQK